MKLSPHDRVLVLGADGMVGSAVVRAFRSRGVEPAASGHRDYDLTDPAQVETMLRWTTPTVVVVAAGRVGGIGVNAARPADFVRDNLMIAANVIDVAHRLGSVRKVVYLGSSCMYPRDSAQPMREDVLLSGPLEPTCRAYAVAKIAGAEMCRAYREQYGLDALVLVPTNLYGPGDNFRDGESHALAAFIRRFWDAKQPETCMSAVSCWGTGTPRREFMHVDDCAEAVVHFAEVDTRSWKHGAGPINVGTGRDATIAEIAEVVRRAVGYEGEIHWAPWHPDGAPQKLLDVSLARSLGWEARVGLEDGVRQTVEWYAANYGTARR